MSNTESGTPEGPIDEAQELTDPQLERFFNDLYEKHSLELAGYARKNLPPEIPENVLSDFWVVVWLKIQSGGFKYQGEAEARGWLFKVLRRRIFDYYRNQSKVMKLLTVESLDDEVAVIGIEASLCKQQDDLSQQVINRELRELLLATGEQRLTNEDDRRIFYRDMAGEEAPPEGWTNGQMHKVRYRWHQKLQKPLQIPLEKLFGMVFKKTKKVSRKK